MGNKRCLECGQVIVGRSDKKFCDDGCRNAYNNRKNRDETNYMRRVNGILRRNRRILQKYAPNGQTLVSRKDLVENGFDFRFRTHSQRDNRGRNYHFVYEFGYTEMDTDTLALISTRNG